MEKLNVKQNNLIIFTDVSVNSSQKIGFGAYLIMSELDLLLLPPNQLQKKIKLKKFKNTSSTKLELQTLIWAFQFLEKKYPKNELINNVQIYTDSQCIVGLEQRRVKLESTNFKSIGKNKKLNNAVLYQKFYKFSDTLNFSTIKVKGHSKNQTKDKIHAIFSAVDKSARTALRNYLNQEKIATKYYVYLLECSDKTLYTGYTTDLEKRIATHNAGKGAKYTKGRNPVKLIWFQEYKTLSEALKEEIRIKKLNKMEKINIFLKI